MIDICIVEIRNSRTLNGISIVNKEMKSKSNLNNIIDVFSFTFCLIITSFDFVVLLKERQCKKIRNLIQNIFIYLEIERLILLICDSDDSVLRIVVLIL